MKLTTSLLILTITVLLAAAGCDDDGTTSSGGSGDTDPPDYNYSLFNTFPDLSFVEPVDLQHSGDQTGRLFVVEQAGLIKVFVNAITTQTAKTFLDISSRTVSGGERGLLGLAFHPDYETNGYFYVYYTPNSSDVTRVARYTVSGGDPDLADAGSEVVVLDIPQDEANHNGGQLGFDPDGYLCISVGDGGGRGDPNDNAQDLTNLLGTILRIDVDSQSLGNYGIPSTNPFALNTKGYRPEIYAFGLRNPWRFSFDPATDRLWVGDVGQDAWEEIDVVTSGGNYGWDCFEGTHVYNPLAQSPACDTLTVAIDPVHEYGHTAGNRSVAGGYVYRGPSLSSLVGSYLFADSYTGRIWAIDYDGSTATPAVEIIDSDLFIATFGVDETNELYICDRRGGNIYRIQEISISP